MWLALAEAWFAEKVLGGGNVNLNPGASQSVVPSGNNEYAAQKSSSNLHSSSCRLEPQDPEIHLFMADAGSRALAKRSIDNALMPPPPKRIKRPAKVLDEDTYTDALSHIIARDFFPGLLEAESQQEYMSAVESQDASWIAEAGRKLTEVMTPGPDGRRLRGRRGTSMTPNFGHVGGGGETPRGRGGDTPGSVLSTTTAITPENERSAVDTNMSLSAFQAKYTSEDNESFYKLLDKQNTKKSEDYAWMWAGNKIPAARQIAYRIQQAQIQASRSSEKQAGGDDQTLMVRQLEDRPAMPDSWIAQPNNNLMFEPNSIEDTHQTVQQKAEEDSRAASKAVVYDNTRMQPATAPKPNLSGTVPPSPTLSAIKDAIAGRPRYTPSEIESAGGETPRVNGYAFVDSEPSPPRELSPGPAARKDYDALLGPGDATPNPFTIREASKREDLHHRMVDRVAKAKRTGKREAELRTPVPKFMSSPRVAKNGLTPAALNLLSNVGSPSTKSVWEGGKTPVRRSGLRGNWTPGQA